MLQVLERIVLILIMIGSYLVSSRYLKDKKQKSIRNIIWCTAVILCGISVGVSAFGRIYFGDTSYIVYAVAGILLQAFNLWHFKYIKSEEKSVNLYRVFIRPITLELAIGGVVLPQLCTVRFLLYGFHFSFLFFNGALVIAVLLFTFLIWDEEEQKDHWRLAGNKWINMGVCYFHMLIIFVTGSVVIPLILRIVYGVLSMKFDFKPPYGSPVDNEKEKELSSFTL